MIKRQYKSKSISQLSTESHLKGINDFSTEAQTLFGFIALIVDIKYRAKYNHALEWRDGKGYSEYMQNEDFPEQIPSVDDGLESVAQRRIPDAV